MKHAVATIAGAGFQFLPVTMKSNSLLAKQTAQWVLLFVAILSALLVAVCGWMAGFGGMILNGVEQRAFLHKQLAGSDAKLVETEDHHCSGRRVFMYDLPETFNKGLLEIYCTDAKQAGWAFCESLINMGMGPDITGLAKEQNLVSPAAWYRTDQFALEVIVHERMKRYSCLTSIPENADSFYIPYYAALDVSMNLFSDKIHDRDRLSQRLMGWLLAKDTFLRNQGRDHVLVLGRIVWDFARKEPDTNWGSSLLRFPEFFNVTKLLIERDAHGYGALGKNIAIPYPTSFHPTRDVEFKEWQEQISTFPREILVSFVGGHRKVHGNINGFLRDALFSQCTKAAPKCGSLDCNKMSCGDNPQILAKLFLRSVFCLQPAGDSPTRKAVFDCLLSGCIPIFFNTYTAYHQYIWHLPAKGDSYSLLLSETAVKDGFDIVAYLESIPQEQIRSMQNVIIRDILPAIIYTMPGKDHDFSFRDAFDIFVDNLFDPGFQNSTFNLM